MPTPTAVLVVVGNEVLSAQVQDENGPWAARRLRELGVRLLAIHTVPDRIDDVVDAVDRARRSADWVFTSGGVGPTHDDVTIEGVARAAGVPVIRHPALVALLEGYYKDALNEAHLKMAEVPEGAELLVDESVRFPTILMRNVYILPGVPEIFRRKFDALRERFRDQPIFLKNVFVSIGEGVLADHLNAIVRAYPDLLCGSYPEFSNPEYKVKITLESRDAAFLDRALAELLARLPADSVVRVA